MASVPLLAASGSAAEDVALEESIFEAEVKPHLVHEAVRAELNADRVGTRGAKSRGLVSGGRSKPWRQKGTGRARAGTTRAPQFKGGGVAFPPGMRSFEVKVNRKASRAARVVGEGAAARHRRRRARRGSREVFPQPDANGRHAPVAAGGFAGGVGAVAAREPQRARRRAGEGVVVSL